MCVRLEWTLIKMEMWTISKSLCSFVCPDVHCILKHVMCCVLQPGWDGSPPCGLPVTSCSGLLPVGLSRVSVLHLKTFCSCDSQTWVPRCILSTSPVRHNNFPFKPETVWFVRRRCIIASIYRPYASCHSFIDSLVGTATVGPSWHPRLRPLISFPQCFFWDRWKRQRFGTAPDVIIHSRIGWLWSGDSIFSGHTPTCLFTWA